MSNIYTIRKTVIFLLTNIISIVAFTQNNNAIRFKITGNGYTDETIVRLVNSATLDFDGNYDAYKLFSPNPSLPAIYTQIANGQELALNSLPEFTEDKSITIYTNIPVSGTYSITIEEIYEITPNYKISLTDLSTSTHYRILNDSTLTFNFTAHQNSPSFTFNISTPLALTTVNETCVNMNDGSTTIINEGNTDWNLQVIDELNNIVIDSLSNTSLTNYDHLTPGNYNATVSSKGIVDSVSFTISSAINLVSSFNMNKDTIYLNEGGALEIINTSINAQNYSWDFGDGGSTYNINPNYVYSTIGDYEISLTSINGNCEATSSQQIIVLQGEDITTSIKKIDTEDINVNSYGNGEFQITFPSNELKQIYVYDTNGKLILQDNSSDQFYNFSLNNKASGMYIASILSESGQNYKVKIIK